jgi:hypothetical protein
MALTKSRTRTQTALTSLCKLVANVHGELNFIEWALQHRKKQLAVLHGRRQALLQRRAALYTTLRVFDPQLDPSSIGTLNEWLKPYGRKVTTRAAGRYLRAHADSPMGSSARGA